MRNCFLHGLALAVAVSTSRVEAQGSVPPAILSGYVKSVGLNPPGTPGASVEQIYMSQLPGDSGSIYTCALTVTALPAANGGAGAQDIVTGKYSVYTDTFTPDLLAAGVNSASRDSGFVFHSSGLIAVWERPGPTIEVATRTNVTAAWVRQGSVTAITGGPSVRNPALADMNGQLVVIYMLGPEGNASIVYSPLDRTTLVAGPATTIVAPSAPARQPNSPTPIMTSTGELIGLSHYELSPTENQHLMSCDLDPATPGVRLVDSRRWKSSGGFAGGRFFDAQHIPQPDYVVEVEAMWWTGGRAAVGTNMEITVNMPGARPTVPLSFCWIFLARGFLQTPRPVWPVINQLGIDTSFSLPLAIGTHDALTGRATAILAIPDDQSLRGVTIPAQSYTLLLDSPPRHVLGNTAALTILP
jgi:hypothetical protein